MGIVTYRDYSYFYEDGGQSEKLFDYRESIKDYTLLPMHSFDNSIDAVYKRAYGIFGDRYASSDPDLVSALFMTYILLVTRHMEEPDPVQVLCVGRKMEWLCELIQDDVKRMNPESASGWTDTFAGARPGPWDVLIAFGDSVEISEIEMCLREDKDFVSDNCRIIFILQDKGLLLDGYSEYCFGDTIVLTRHIRNATDEIIMEEYQRVGEQPKRTIETVAAFTPHDTPFTNVELIKDIGAVPFLFHKIKNCKVYMVGIDRNGEYPFAKYTEGTELVKLSDYSLESKLRWLEEYAKKIDCLLLYGTYRNNFAVATDYKRLRPDGVIYLALDANAFWVNNIQRFDKDVDEFYSSCDVIGTSTMALKKFITKKWKLDISIIRCGYYPFGISELSKPEYSEKKNVILTVGRIGTGQKKNEVLMQAFAKAYDELPDWELRLVGPIENEFYGFIEEFMDEYPFLEDVITFTGNIEEKEVLHKEFMQAKVFALSSEFEGFPNVIPEAMSAGDVIVTTDIDNSDDIIDYGRCGMKSPIGNIDAFSHNLRILCNDEELLRSMSENSYSNYVSKFDYNKIVDKLYDLLLRV